MTRVCVVLLTVFACGTSVAQTAPELVNYQGKLTDASGEPLVTQDYTVSFRIFDAPSGGAELWGPQEFDGETGEGHGPKVPVVKGYFNVILGPRDTHNPSRALSQAFATENAYLEIQIGGAPPLQPRQQILSAPYAMNAKRAAEAAEADHATSADNGAPVGTIVAYREYAGKNPIPDGWEICDGHPIASGPLAGENTPDLRDRFPMGKGAGGSGATGGSQTSGPRAGGADLNAHTHETILQGSLADPGRTWVVHMNAIKDSFGMSDLVAPNDVYGISGGWYWKTDARFWLTRPPYKTDLNSHTHGLPMPPYFTVVYIIRVR